MKTHQNSPEVPNISRGECPQTPLGGNALPAPPYPLPPPSYFKILYDTLFGLCVDFNLLSLNRLS